MINLLDSFLAYFVPGRALRRAHARRVLSYYEAGKPDRQRKQRRERGSGNTALLRAGTSIREQARYLDQNHDLSRGILNALVQNVVGPTGIGIEPLPRDRDGKILRDLSDQIIKRHRVWSERPEVTWRLDRAAMERLMCRSWLRDGDAFAQAVVGEHKTLKHGTTTPLSLELIESDMVPLDYNRAATEKQNRILSGVELNGWNRPVAYHIYKSHPGETYGIATSRDLKRRPADRVFHLQMMDSRINQVRGASLFAAIMSRLDDLKDYEQSERIAAKVAASMAGFIKKGTPDLYAAERDEAGEEIPRELKFNPGMIFDDLLPGEEIGTIDTSRPNTNLESHRNGQLRAVASGSYLTYSSLSKNYDGTYSAQRQELVEGYGAYGVLASEFINQFVRPAYKLFLEAEITAGNIIIPANMDSDTWDDALYLPPQMPWIDPAKEANSFEVLERNGHASGPEIIRRRGQRPDAVREQEIAWRLSMQDMPSLPPGFGGTTVAEPDQNENEVDQAHAKIKKQA